MKIIHINTSLGNGGLENMMVDIANEQCKIGHYVVVIIINNKIDYNILRRINYKISVFTINREIGSKSIMPFFKLFILFRKIKQVDIIHAHGTYLGKFLKYIINSKIVHTVHDVYKPTGPLKYYDKVYAISNAVKNDIEVNSTIIPTVIYNGIKIENIKIKNRDSQKYFAEYKLVHVSRLEHEKKGQDILLYALNHLLNENKLQANLSMDFVGDGKSREYLEELSETLGLSNNVNFIGNKPREWVYEHLADYDLFILPSRYEGFGLTVAEAMAAKLPVIAAHNDGPAEILAKGKYGFLFENGNPKDLAAKIFHVVDLLKQGKLDDMIESAYQHCLEKYDVKVTAVKYVEEYNVV